MCHPRPSRPNRRTAARHRQRGSTSRRTIPPRRPFRRPSRSRRPSNRQPSRRRLVLQCREVCRVRLPVRPRRPLRRRRNRGSSLSCLRQCNSRRRRCRAVSRYPLPSPPRRRPRSRRLLQGNSPSSLPRCSSPGRRCRAQCPLQHRPLLRRHRPSRRIRVISPRPLPSSPNSRRRRITPPMTTWPGAWRAEPSHRCGSRVPRHR